jgi:hypothetical protein
MALFTEHVFYCMIYKERDLFGYFRKAENTVGRGQVRRGMYIGDRKSNHPSPDIVPAATLKTPALPAPPRPLGYHWASPGPDAALTRPFGATGSATSTARPTARSRRRPVCPLTNRCVDRARHRVLPGLTRPSQGRLAPPARHHLHPVRHTRPKAAARAPGRWAAPGRPHRCAPGSA